MARVVTSGKTARSSAYVTVACKLPQGFVIPVQGKPHLRLHGTNSPFVRNGFGMTEVKTELWQQILQQYGEREGTDRFGAKCMIPEALWLTNRIVFAHADTKNVNAEAKDREKIKVGFEPIDPKKPNDSAEFAAIQREGANDPGMPGLD